MKGYKDSEILMLLTATITPQFENMYHTPEERKKQYISAIMFYLEKTPYPMVICENSGYYNLLESIDKSYHERIEYICFQETNKARNYGYNEMIILEKIKKESQFLKDAKLIIKLTGRIIIKNIVQLTSQVKKERGHFLAANINRNLQYISSRCFFFTTSMYDTILSKKDGIGAITYKYVRDGGVIPPDKYVDIESAIAGVIKEELQKDLKSFKFLHYPMLISGVSGYYGTDLETKSTMKLIQKYIKHLLRVLDWYLLVMPKIKRHP